MDLDAGGKVLFDEFCSWYTEKVTPGRVVATSTTQFMAPRKGKKVKPPKAWTTEQVRLKKEFDLLEADFIAIAKDRTKLKLLWDRMDSNGSGTISLAEIDILMVTRYPLLNFKPAIMRAYKQTCLQEGGDGDACIDPPEFPQLLVCESCFKCSPAFVNLSSVLSVKAW